MLFCKKNILVLLLLVITHCSFSQTNTVLNRFYIKLSPALHFETPKNILDIEAINNLNNRYPFKIYNAYSISNQKIEKLAKQSQSNHTLKNTFRIEAVLDHETAKKLLEGLQKLPNLVYAYQANLTPIKPPHDIAPITTDIENNQGYIESNPGMHVRYAWDNGINGTGINIRAVEYGMNTNHEDLDHTNAAFALNTTINSGATLAYTEHGTSVASIVFANKGTYGISGLAHGANEYILYPEWTEEYGYNRVLATSNAIDNSASGDIIIFEMQTYGPNGNFVLAEYEQAIWDLTKAATDAGIIIVAAAGNGGVNLDATSFNNYNARGDSGAIIVGAGSANTMHLPLWYTTYGSRVNVHSWGQNVYTTGVNGCDIVFGNDFNQTYNSCFGGTSSATALVGGFTAVLQSYYFEQTGNHLSAQELRMLMVNTGIAQGAGVSIGPLPNMQAAILELNNTLSTAHHSFSNFIMYPNPTHGILNINLKNTIAADLEIHNIMGQKILERNLKSSNNKIALNNIAKDLYLVTIKTEKTATTKKLIIN